MLKRFLTQIIFMALMANINIGYSMIPKRYVAKMSDSVSFLGLGTVELGRDWGIDQKRSLHPRETKAKLILETAYQLGMTVIDTASSYQLSEERIGRYLPRSRNHYLLITKPGEHSLLATDARCKIAAYDNIYCHHPGAVYDFSPQAIIKDVHESLKKLKVNRIDVALLHLDNATAKEVFRKKEALRTLLVLKKANLVRFVGVSINGPIAKAFVTKHDIDFIELEYNLLNQSNKDTIKLAHQKGIGVIVRGGLGTGLLTPYVEQHIDDPKLPYGPQVRALLKLTHNNYHQLTALALAFLYENPNISTVVIGADQPQFIEHDIKLLNNFNDPKLLRKAKALLVGYKTPEQFTEIMGEFYQAK